jgi:NTE family protein
MRSAARAFIASIAALLLGGQPRAQTTDAVPAARPKIGLVLSGGGARGFAHIGVLKELQRLHVPVDVIAATSMGSIAGGAYAAGYTPRELEQLVRATDWNTIFARRAPRADLAWRLKEDDYRNLFTFELGIKEDGLTLPRGAAGAQELGLLLRALGGVVRDVDDLAELPIPFAAMATDLATGKLVVLQKGASLSTAMRASMSVPGAFAPIDYQGRPLVDGALVRNLPVDIARRMGADIVIVVNAGTQLLPRDKLTDVIAVGQQMINILTEQNVERSLAELAPRDILIKPDLADVSAGDFAKGAAIVAAGEAAARAVADRLAALAVSPERYAQWEEARTVRLHAQAPTTIVEVRVDGLRTVSPASVLAAIDLPRNVPIDTAEVQRQIRRVYASGDFESVSYNLLDAPGGKVLVVTPLEKSWGYNSLQLGGSLQTNFSNDNRFNLLVLHTWSWLNRAGGTWRNELQFGTLRRLGSEFMQPFAAGSRWLAVPRVRLERESFDLFSGGRAIAQFESREEFADLSLRYLLGSVGMMQLGVGHAHTETRLLTGSTLPPPGGRTDGAIARGQLTIDTLDAVGYPRTGYSLGAGITYFDGSPGSAGRKTAAQLSAVAPKTYGRYTLVASVAAATSNQAWGVRYGGLFNLSGTPRGELAGSSGMLVRGVFYRNVSDAFGDIRMPIFGGLSLEAATALAPGAAFAWSDFRRAAALFFGAESPVGPLYFALGKTFGGSSALYFLWGRPQ